ncbi:DMT family transporter [Achromobacter marplatensis]|uniref:DMT family transporter n=1 Tax=Achromobacter marplatensis TaxID=470868 RepID=UPI0039F72260
MLLTAPALFASNMVAARWAHDASLPPVFLAFGRWLLALLILLPLAAPALRQHRRALWRGLPALLPLAVLGMGVAVAPQYIGAQTTSATNIALIFSCSPILVALLEALIWRKPLSALRAAGLGLALGGVLVVLSRGDLQALARLAFGQGDLWVLLAATGWALYTVLQKRLTLPAVPDHARLATMMLGGVLALAPFAGIEAAAGATPPWTDPRLAAVLLFLAVVPSLGAYYVYGRLISQAGPATAGLSMFLVPVYAALLAWPLLGETPQLFHAYGFVMILMGVKMASTRMRTGAATAAAPA